MPLEGPFLRNALRLQELLRDRPICIAVGYSFPDAHVRTWLAEAMHRNPDLVLYVVDPFPEWALRNLVSNLGTLPWISRLRIVAMKFEEAVSAGFESCLAAARPFGPDFRHIFAPSTLPPSLQCFPRRAAGLASSQDGDMLFISEQGEPGKVYKVDLRMPRPAAPELFASGLKDPRGIAVMKNGDLLVVQNRLFHWKRLPLRGAGSVVKISATGRHRKILTSFRLSDLRGAIKALHSGLRSALLWPGMRSILRWPTDIAIAHDQRIFATEARALVEISGHGHGPARICEPPLAFNLHGLDVADDGALVGVEQGVSQQYSWGRVTRFELEPNGVRCTISSGAEGHTRLMGICFVSSRAQVVITKSVAWPLGGLLVLDYPALDNAKFLSGFDFPQKIAFVSGRDLLAVGTASGVELVPVSALDEAQPIGTS